MAGVAGGGDQTLSRLHQASLSSGFPRLLLYNLARRAADQSFACSVSRCIIYTSVKSTIRKKTIKAP